MQIVFRPMFPTNAVSDYSTKEPHKNPESRERIRLSPKMNSDRLLPVILNLPDYPAMEGWGDESDPAMF